uniref:G-protein coupled receptors family 1 profile domain-containing protein n=1 Tax=Anser brachyrhynchus TaxID=132585 RepID=A0A8B9ICZ8_9AVES
MCSEKEQNYTGFLSFYACEIDVPDMAMDGVTLLICLCGLVGNGAVLWLLGFRIRRNPITVYILNLAVADFTFLLFMLTSADACLLEDPPEGDLEGHQGAAPPAAPHQEVDEGVDAAVDAAKQENHLGLPQHVTEML